MSQSETERVVTWTNPDGTVGEYRERLSRNEPRCDGCGVFHPWGDCDYVSTANRLCECGHVHDEEGRCVECRCLGFHPHPESNLDSASDLPSAVPAENLQAGSRTTGALSILDLFAGPGGWDVALKRMGLDPLGVEWDAAACKTREAAGLRTLQGNVAELDPCGFGHVDLFIASPPCQAWSMAGKRLGEKDKEHVIACAHELAMGNDTRSVHGQQCEDSRSMLVVEPIRFIRALRPTYVALEQVPPVLELWTLFATFLEQWGYSVWTGVLEAERYGVPQTRERAILIASLNGPVAPPEPTHQRYIPGEPQRHDITFDGEILPWVSMAEALGWGMTARPTLTVNGSKKGEGSVIAGGSGAQGIIAAEREAGRWADVDVPAPTVTAGGTGSGGPEPFGRGGRERLARCYDRRQGSTKPNGERVPVRPIPETEPAPTIAADGLAKGRDVWVEDRPAPTIVTTRRSEDGIVVGRQLPDGEGENVGGKNWFRNNSNENAGRRPVTEPAPTTFYGHASNEVGWVPEPDERVNKTGVRVTEQEAAALQSFPPDYPFQGSRSKRFEQIGNAVPPLLAEAILRALLEMPKSADLADAEKAA